MGGKGAAPSLLALHCPTNMLTDSSSGAFGYKSRARTEPTSVTLPQWTAAFWAKLEQLMEDIAGCCIKVRSFLAFSHDRLVNSAKVYTLENVLKARKEATTQLSFLDEAMTALDNMPSLIFWTTLSQALEAQARTAAKGAFRSFSDLSCSRYTHSVFLCRSNTFDWLSSLASTFPRILCQDRCAYRHRLYPGAAEVRCHFRLSELS